MFGMGRKRGGSVHLLHPKPVMQHCPISIAFGSQSRIVTRDCIQVYETHCTGCKGVTPYSLWSFVYPYKYPETTTPEGYKSCFRRYPFYKFQQQDPKQRVDLQLVSLQLKSLSLKKQNQAKIIGVIMDYDQTEQPDRVSDKISQRNPAKHNRTKRTSRKYLE